MAIARSKVGFLKGKLWGRGASAPRPPALLWLAAGAVAATMLLPLAYMVVRTLGAGSEIWDLILRPRTAAILGRTILLVVAVTAACIALALPLAWLTVRSDIPGRRLWAILTALPLVIPSFVGGYVVVAALGPRGLLQQLLAPLGVERLPEIYGFPGAFLTITLLTYPYVMFTVRGALWRLDPALEETARSLGIGARGTFFRVTLPHLRPAIAAGGLLAALYTLHDFGAVSLLRYETFTWAIYIQYETAARSLAAGLSLLLAALALLILLVEVGTRGRGRYYRGGGSPRPPSIVPLGRWRWPALAFCGLVVALALALPLSVLGYWLARGIAAGEPFRLMWGAAVNSLYVSGLAAMVTVAAALPVTFLAVRFLGRVSALLERSTYLGFALPGIVVALALVFFAVNYARPLYQTLGLLIFAYVVLFLPAAGGSIRSALLQINPSLEEAARSLGRRPLRVLTGVTLPLVRSGLLAGGALVFLTTMKELPATLLLSPTGFKTLATSIWGSVSEAFFARAATPALLLVLASSLGMAIFIFQERRQER
ncbi:MAG: iron ABC transporter permease [Chloroflexi bacterium]|nr:iron ABC transporter permease [Chloroflexota bacterium]